MTPRRVDGGGPLPYQKTIIAICVLGCVVCLFFLVRDFLR